MQCADRIASSPVYLPQRAPFPGVTPPRITHGKVTGARSCLCVPSVVQEIRTRDPSSLPQTRKPGNRRVSVNASLSFFALLCHCRRRPWPEGRGKAQLHGWCQGPAFRGHLRSLREVCKQLSAEWMKPFVAVQVLRSRIQVSLPGMSVVQVW